MRARPRSRQGCEGAPRRAAPFACRLVVLAKVPVAGRVKTRLARDIGTGRATWMFRHTLAAVLGRVARSAHWRTVLSIAPDNQVATRVLPRGPARRPQGAGDIGRRMSRPFERLPPGPVVLIGVDLPDVRPEPIRRAFRLLGSHDAVFGPATDGGFWLVGFRRRPAIRAGFGTVRWSSPHTLADTLANLAGMSIAFTATLSDLDDARDLARLDREPGRLVLPRV